MKNIFGAKPKRNALGMQKSSIFEQQKESPLKQSSVVEDPADSV